jgi:hypothetical protein
VRNTLAIFGCLLAGCSSEESNGGPNGPRGAPDSGTDARDASDGADTGPDVDAGDSGASDADSGDAGAPAKLRVDGTASGSVGGSDAGADGGSDRVECHFFAEIDQLVVSPDGSFTGFGVGEVFRTAYPGDQRFEFSAFVAGEVSVTHTSESDVEARLVGDQPEDAKAFWLELEVIGGRKVGAFSYDGTWTCAPILLDDPGFIDIDLDVPGTWQIRPAP